MSPQLPLAEQDRRALQIIADHTTAGGLPWDAFGALMWDKPISPGTKGFLDRLKHRDLIKVRYGNDHKYELTLDGREALTVANANLPERILMSIEHLTATYSPAAFTGSWDALFDQLWSANTPFMDSLSSDIQTSGIREPIVIFGQQVAQGHGHKRLAAAAALGFDEVPVRHHLLQR